MCDSFLPLYMKEISYILENQSTGCHEDYVTLHVMKEVVGQPALRKQGQDVLRAEQEHT